MSRTAGPTVPSRTGNCDGLALAGSTSSNFFSDMLPAALHAAGCRIKARSLHHFDEVADLRLLLRIEPVQQLELFLLVAVEGHGLRVVLELRVSVDRHDLDAVRLRKRILRGLEIADGLDHGQ